MTNLIWVIVLIVSLLHPNVQAGAKGWILFTDVGDHWKLKVIRVEPGAQVQQLFADDDGNNGYANWLPDGQSIGFTRRDPIDGAHLTVRAIAGRSYRYISPDDNQDRSWPVWSPNGKWIAFAEFAGVITGWDLMVMPAAGGHERFLAHLGDWEKASWSPDSKRLAFVGVRKLDTKTFLMQVAIINVDGSGLRFPLPRSFADLALAPAWSPDGKWIAFDSFGEKSPKVIDVMDPQGGQLRVLGPGSDPSWSPDSSEIAYTTDHAEQSILYIVNLATGVSTELARGGSDAFEVPTWSPTVQVKGLD